jgi:pimeloyl-ACP methyl ester carboxylesterase
MFEIELSAGTIEYEDTGGDGPVAVLLHGLAMDGSLWRHVVAEIRSDHRCVVPRRRFARATLERAKREGVLAEDVDVDELMDMMAGAVLYRLLIQPGKADAAEIRRFLEAVVRQAGLREKPFL